MTLSREQYDIILAGRDQTGAAFASAQRNAALMQTRVQSLTNSMRVLGATGAAGGGGALAALLQSFAVGGPLVLGLAAVSLAAEQFWRTNREEAPAAERDLREHNRILGEIKTSYRDAAAQASQFYQQRRAILLQEAQANLVARRDQLRDAMTRPEVSTLRPPPELFANQQGREQLLGTLGALNDAIGKLRSGGDVAAYIDSVERIRAAAGQASPELGKLADQALLNAKGMLESAEAVEMAEAAVAALQGTATKTQLALLGLGETAKKTDAERVPAAQRVISALELERDNLSRTAIERRVYNELARAGVAIHTEQGVAIRNLVTQIEAQRIAMARGREEAQYFGDAVMNSLDALILRGERAEDVLRNVVSQLARAALQAAILGQGPLAGLFGTGATGGQQLGGLMGALGGMFGKRARGGPVSAGVPYWVGEEGRPELFVPERNGFIVPEDKAAGGAAGGLAQNVNVTINGTNLSQQQLTKAISDALDRYDRWTLPGRVQQINADPLARG